MFVTVARNMVLRVAAQRKELASKLIDKRLNGRSARGAPEVLHQRAGDA